MSSKIKPMLAKGSPHPVGNVYPAIFKDGSHLWEIKYDGIRLLSFINKGITSLQARSGTNKTHTFPELRIETKVPAVLDGEVISAAGLSFQDSIQKRMNRKLNIDAMVKLFPVKKAVFDVLEVDGKNVEHLPLETRKEMLADIFIPTDNAELAPYTEDGVSLWNEVTNLGLEGIVGKNKQGAYLRDKREWLKVKAWKRNYGIDSTGETFLVVGYTKGTGWRESIFGALEIARLEADGTSTYVGEAGTGYDRAEMQHLCSLFSPAACPWAKEPLLATWVQPFACWMQYLEYSNDGMMRFPSFKGVV